jgi:hypothetical protein
MKYRLGCRLDGKILVSMDLVVILWKILFHRLGCRLMENFSFHGLGCRPMESFVVFFFCYHRLDCCLMDVYMYIFFAIDLIVVLWKFPFPWTWLLPYGGFLVSWIWLSSYERFSVVSMDLVVVLWKILLFPRTWLSSCGKF